MRFLHVIAALLLSPLAVLASPAQAGPALLFDPEDGKILYAEDPDSQWHPASLTKIMTAYIAFEAVKSGRLPLTAKIPCTHAATLVQPSKLGLPVGTEITVEVALQALIIKSANDVAIMLAEAIAGSEPAFVNIMNVTARRLGMTRTTFLNANGLPAPGQVTTARDLAKLGRAVLRDFPEFAHWWSIPEMQIGKTKLVSHNSLLRTFEGADGLKTGFICDSGFNVVASATREGKRLMAVVLGEQTGNERALRAGSLLEHGFQQLGWKQMFNTNTIDAMPIAADAKGVISMRQSVVSWECGTGRPPAANVAQGPAGAKKKSKKSKTAKAGKPDKGKKQAAGTKKVAAPAAAAHASGSAADVASPAIKSPANPVPATAVSAPSPPKPAAAPPSAGSGSPPAAATP
jgi:D-alanyl-D-alanine carboxypeptidase